MGLFHRRDRQHELACDGLTINLESARSEVIGALLVGLIFQGPFGSLSAHVVIRRQSTGEVLHREGRYEPWVAQDLAQEYLDAIERLGADEFLYRIRNHWRLK